MAQQYPSPMEVFGQVKRVGYGVSCSAYNEGSIQVAQSETGLWVCRLYHQCSEEPRFSVPLRNIKKIIYKSRMLIEFTDGQTFYLRIPKCERDMMVMGMQLESIKSGNIITSPATSPSLAAHTVTSLPSISQNAARPTPPTLADHIPIVLLPSTSKNAARPTPPTLADHSPILIQSVLLPSTSKNAGSDCDSDDNEFFGYDEEDFNNLWMAGYRMDDFLDGNTPSMDEDFEWS